MLFNLLAKRYLLMVNNNDFLVADSSLSSNRESYEVEEKSENIISDLRKTLENIDAIIKKYPVALDLLQQLLYPDRSKRVSDMKKVLVLRFFN
jgi:hypothetical protein